MSATPSSSNDGTIEVGTDDEDRAIPGWITNQMIEDTIRTFQPYYQDTLQHDDAVQMLLSVSRMFEVVWDG